MSVGAVTPSLHAPAGAGLGAPASGSAGFAAAISAATGQAGPGAASTAANPFSQMGTDVQSFLVQLGSSGEAKDTSATTASASSTVGLHGHGHGHHHGGKAEGSGDLATDFANNAIN